jgi:hypothetical protein
MHPIVLLGDEAQVEAHFGPFRGSANLTQDSCSVCTKRAIGDVGQVESHFSLFGDRVSVGARLVHDMCQIYHRLRHCFGRTRWYS